MIYIVYKCEPMYPNSAQVDCYQLRRKTPAFRYGDIRRRKRDRFTNLHCRKIANVV